MNYTSILFAFILSTIFGSAFHLWRGGGAGKLLTSLISSWIGFIAGHWIVSNLDWTFDLVGQIHLLFGCIGSVIAIFLGNFLSFTDKK